MVRKGKDTPPVVEEHPGGGHITVTAQQSRYALDAVDAPASKEVTSPFYTFCEQVLIYSRS
jgi:ATP-binding cassette subfamily F protein 3